MSCRLPTSLLDSSGSDVAGSRRVLAGLDVIIDCGAESGIPARIRLGFGSPSH
jgi:hypothetical protein